MTQRELFEGFEPANTTPVPDVLFDQLLAELSGAELKIMLYIIRRTWGFKKNEDAISLSQFQHGIETKDGRQLDKGCGVKDRTTLVKALNNLEKKSYIKSIKVVKENGEHVTTLYSVRFKGERNEGSREILPRTMISLPGVVGKPDQGSRENGTTPSVDFHTTGSRETRRTRNSNTTNSVQETVSECASNFSGISHNHDEHTHTENTFDSEEEEQNKHDQFTGSLSGTSDRDCLFPDRDPQNVDGNQERTEAPQRTGNQARNTQGKLDGPTRTSKDFSGASGCGDLCADRDLQSATGNQARTETPQYTGNQTRTPQPEEINGHGKHRMDTGVGREPVRRGVVARTTHPQRSQTQTEEQKYSEGARTIRKMYDEIALGPGKKSGHPHWDWQAMEDMAQAGVSEEDLRLVYNHLKDAGKKYTVQAVWENWTVLATLKNPTPPPSPVSKRYPKLPSVATGLRPLRQPVVGGVR